MTSTEQRDADQALRQRRERRDEQQRRLQRAIAAERRLTDHLADRRHGPSEREAGHRYAYLTRSHD